MSIVVNEWLAPCPHTETLSPVGQEAMLMYNGTLYVHDRRMQMIENTLVNWDRNFEDAKKDVMDKNHKYIKNLQTNLQKYELKI